MGIGWVTYSAIYRAASLIVEIAIMKPIIPMNNGITM